MGFCFSFLPSRRHIELEKYDISILDNICLPFLFILPSSLPKQILSMCSICSWEFVLYKYTWCALFVIYYKIYNSHVFVTPYIYIWLSKLLTTSMYRTNELIYSNQLSQLSLSLSHQYYFWLKKCPNNSLPLQRPLIPTPLGPQIS